jgi:hypothetical protein
MSDPCPAASLPVVVITRLTVPLVVASFDSTADVPATEFTVVPLGMPGPDTWSLAATVDGNGFGTVIVGDPEVTVTLSMSKFGPKLVS